MVTWLLNRQVTFPDRDRGARPHIELGRYFLAMLAGGAVNWCAYAIVLQWLPRAAPWPLLAVATGSLAGMGVNLALAQHFVFRPKPKQG
jgi:putative flippase GtrA